MEENYQALIDAIIMQAVKDYRTALKALKRNPNNKAAMSLKKEVERFIRSTWFGQLMEIDPELFIERLNREVKPE